MKKDKGKLNQLIEEPEVIQCKKIEDIEFIQPSNSGSEEIKEKYRVSSEDKLQKEPVPDSNVSNNKSDISEKKENINIEQNINEILQKRAEELSEEVDESKEDDEFINIVEFLLNDETYAVDASYTKQVAKLKDLTTIPCTPSYVLGVTSMQEQIISVIDIRSFFQMESKAETNLNKIVVLEKKDTSFAIAADDVIGIKKVYLKTIQKTIDTFDNIRKKFFYGLTEDQTIILDGGKILADQDIIVK